MRRRGRWIKRFFGGAVLLLLIASAAVAVDIILSMPDVADLRTRDPGTTALIEQRVREAARAGHPLTIQQEWVAFDRIPRLLKEAVRVAEDAAFYTHNGIDYIELRAAIKRDLDEGRFARGASTITQQLAKNLYLSTAKSPLRKLKEYFIARRLERALGKERIFHLYLNLIELGPGIFGVQAAARHYFDRDVAELDLEQAVRLTAVIPRPLRTDPRGASTWLRWRAAWILKTLRAAKVIGDEEYEATRSVFE
jgi:monofunctional biosynthetic peptidoglycan transglycosylase